jgi:CheY-like chemotaxis protein
MRPTHTNLHRVHKFRVESSHQNFLSTIFERAMSQPLILVVDDNQINRNVIILQLRKLGYATDTASCGIEALQKVDARKYDLILMDCHMPEMDGYEATKEIRKREGTAYHTPIIALTVQLRSMAEPKCLAAGMDAFLSNPVKTAVLQETISRLIKQRPKILIVNNQRTHLTRLEQQLKNLGFDTNLVDNVVEALELLIAGGCFFDLILADLTMLELNGIQLASRIHKLGNDQHIKLIGVVQDVKYLDLWITRCPDMDLVIPGGLTDDELSLAIRGVLDISKGT